MAQDRRLDDLEVGYDIPAAIGMDEAAIQTPCLILDLDALERNIVKMGGIVAAQGLRLRAHGKMHKSADVARLQMRLGGATGLCCQKVSEAEAFVRAGISDLLISNEVRDPVKIDRLARLPLRGARIGVCVDDLTNVPDLSAAAVRHGTRLECLVEIDCGSGRCGLRHAADVVDLARAIGAAPNLHFGGIQAYQGAMQHLRTHAERAVKSAQVIAKVRDVLAALSDADIACATVTGGGTGSYGFEAASGLYTELQCGSYAFMDADYGRVLNENGQRMDEGTWENALFLLTSVMSHPGPDRAIVDAGLKVQSLDSGLPEVFGRSDVTYTEASDEHGIVADPLGVLKVHDKLRLVPGHCDPTCNLHDWYVGVRKGKVETLWPVTARGKML
ncbi:DSD1 family PLP-dependent enzyme [Pseudoruegeria sp. SK021]|uniref:DSD1 family PLP-dependent enzyme n=1 Tax=Pseudoruegeria sp. SK021 TaxID=1933035 RepID=UPI000A23FFF1|nr:DSD1 family PLP-dependent enzyme [Pseudoruegeria sp. SK021]OSP56000.1 alanine racemase [Pseudoruegeria sp. SK021]